MVVIFVSGLPGAAPLPGADAAFFGVFGVFVVAFLVLVVITLRWAVRRDRVGRAEWLRRRRDEQPGPPVPPPYTNGRAPSRRGQRGGDPRRPG